MSAGQLPGSRMAAPCDDWWCMTTAQGSGLASILVGSAAD
jgi:hypothetical protein